MTTEIATRTEDELPAGMQQLVHYTRVLEAADAYAQRLARMAIAGPNYRGKPEDALGAILYGAELGLNPVQSLQQVFCVHGTPAIYARTMVALLKRKGFTFRTVESADEKVTVTGTAPDGSTETSTWTIERAQLAGYVPEKDSSGRWKTNSNGKLAGNMKYLTDPQGMLYAKCTAEISRKLAPDVLLGIAYSYEDLESEPAPVTVVSERVDADPVSAADILGADDDVRDDESVAEGLASDNPQEDIPANVTPEPTTSNPVAKPEPPQVKRTSSRARKAPGNPPAAEQKAPEPAAEPTRNDVPTIEQLTELAEVLGNEGLDTTEQKLEYLSQQLNRKITKPNQVHPDEIDELIGFLRTEQDRDAEQRES